MKAAQQSFDSLVRIVSSTCLLLLFFSVAAAEGQPESGFLDDYSKLVPSPYEVNGFRYEAPGAHERLPKYKSIMVDQPEIILAPDSKKGLKPDEAKLIADTLRLALITALERGQYRLVTTPGPDTLYLRTGMTNVYLKNKPKRLIQFTPIGLAITIVSTPFKDVMDKLLLTKVAFEAEILDAETAELFGMVLTKSGDSEDKKQFTSWEEFHAALEVRASRLACKLDNGHLPESEQRDCGEIGAAQ
jgi:hypothetical protein